MTVYSVRTYYFLHLNYRAASMTVIFEMASSIYQECGVDDAVSGNPIITITVTFSSDSIIKILLLKFTRH